MSTIITRNSATSGSIPSSLIQGELAINVTDGKLFYGSGSGNIVKEFTGSGGPINSTPFRIATGSISASVDTGNNIFLITQNNIPIFSVSQSGVIVIVTQSIELTGSAPNGGIYFTSGALYVGID
jgi:hypothetical protein